MSYLTVVLIVVALPGVVGAGKDVLVAARGQGGLGRGADQGGGGAEGAAGPGGQGGGGFG